MDENLAENVSFVLDSIIDDIDDPYKETLEAALILTKYSWNTEIENNPIVEGSYKRELKKLQDLNPRFWTQLTLNDVLSLIDILMKRKSIFYPDDKRLVKKCFINVFGTISVVEDNNYEIVHVQSRF
jgi:hypothetical protein